jgi:hypothetical protein
MPELIRHLWQLKTVVFLHWCLIHIVLLKVPCLLQQGIYYSRKNLYEICLKLETSMDFKFIVFTRHNNIQQNHTQHRVSLSWVLLSWVLLLWVSLFWVSLLCSIKKKVLRRCHQIFRFDFDDVDPVVGSHAQVLELLVCQDGRTPDHKLPPKL